ncbi:MAG: hypothetical protein IT381_08100 [Deltaproteobacteria bacterium]|nr:hypothetical protein [Deltaproteobacteria bacterium]
MIRGARPTRPITELDNPAGDAATITATVRGGEIAHIDIGRARGCALRAATFQAPGNRVARALEELDLQLDQVNGEWKATIDTEGLAPGRYAIDLALGTFGARGGAMIVTAPVALALVIEE